MAISRTGNFFEDAANGYLSIGETAVGGLTVNGGSVLILDDTNNSDDPYLAFGRLGSGNGTGVITGAGSEVRLVGSGIPDVGATVHVGRFGTGSLTVENGGALTIVDTTNVDNVYVGISVARASGSGTLTVDNGSVELSGAGTYLQIGREGGTGSVTISNGSDVSMTADRHESAVQVGREGGSGTLIIDNSSLTVSGTSGANAFMGVGFGGASASEGTLTVRNGADLLLHGNNSELRVGRHAGSSGEIEILSGGSVTLTDTGANEYGGAVFVGQFTGITKAEILVDGAGSLLDGNDAIVIGGNAFFGATQAGNGLVTVRNGGTLTAQDIVVGLGGTLVAHGATLNVDNYVGVGGGTFVVKTVGGPVTINGSLANQLDGLIAFEVAANGGSAGRIVLSGDFYMDATATIHINALGGYEFTAGQTYTLITGTAAGDYDFDGVTAEQFTVSGQSADFGYLFARSGNNMIFRTLTNGDGSGNAILNFGSLTSVGAIFTYDSSIDAGTGSGGLFGEVVASNVNEIRGTGANDVFTVNGSSPMVMSGVDGDDQLTGGSGNDSIKGGAGADTIDGGLGNDIATYIGSNAGVTVNLATGAGSSGHAQGDTLASIERLTGSGLADTLTGNAGANTINGYIGNDTIIGGAGGDTLLGSSGIDTVSYAGSNAGVTVDIQANTASGGHATGDKISGFENITGSSFNDSLTGNSLANVLTGGQGDDTLVGAGGADTLNGGAGNDTAVYSASTAGVTVDLQAGTASGGHAAGDTFSSVENLVGSDFDDTLTGNSLASNLSGGIGDDSLSGGGGDDNLTGGNGNDTLRGWTGFDFLDGGSGNDIVYGDADNDTLIGSSGNDTLNGGAANDTLNGGSGNDTLIGATGGDNLAGSTGDDTLIGGTGRDNFTFLVNYDNDSISGFEDDVDNIRLDDALWGGGLTAAEVLATYAVQTSPGVVTLDFGNGDMLRVVNGAGVSIAALENDIVII